MAFVVINKHKRKWCPLRLFCHMGGYLWLAMFFISFLLSTFGKAFASPEPAGSWASVFTSLMAHSSSSSRHRNSTAARSDSTAVGDEDGPSVARVAQLHRIALSYRALNPRREHLRYFVGYPCTADEPFKCLFSHCMINTTGTCGCQTEADEALFLGLFCLPTRALGQTCVAHEQCSQKITGSECARLTSQTEVGHCICAKGYFLDTSSSSEVGSSGDVTRCVRNEAVMGSATASDNNNNFVDLLGEPAELQSFFTKKDFERRRHRCQNDSNCMLNGRCNTSSGQCECRAGFELNDSLKQECVDIDECAIQITIDGREYSACQGTIGYAQCVNTIGSYECRCVGNATKGRLRGKAPDGLCCGTNEIPCDAEPQCVRIDRVCDGFADCSNAYDEMFSFCFPNINITIPPATSSSSMKSNGNDETRQISMSLTMATTEKSSNSMSRFHTLPYNLVLWTSTPPPVRSHSQPARFHDGDEWNNNRLRFPLDKGSSLHNIFPHKTSFFKLEPSLTGRLNINNADADGSPNSTLATSPTYSQPHSTLATSNQYPSEADDEKMDQLFLTEPTSSLLNVNKKPVIPSVDSHWPSSPSLAQSLQPPTAPSSSASTTTTRSMPLLTVDPAGRPSSTILSARIRILQPQETISDTGSTSFLHDYDREASATQLADTSRTSRWNNNQHYLVSNGVGQQSSDHLVYRKDLGIWVAPSAALSPAAGRDRRMSQYRFKRQIMNFYDGGMDQKHDAPAAEFLAPTRYFPLNAGNTRPPSPVTIKTYGMAGPVSSFANASSSSYGDKKTKKTRLRCAVQPDCQLWKWYASIKGSYMSRRTKMLKPLVPETLPPRATNFVPPPPPVAEFYTAVDNPQLLRVSANTQPTLLENSVASVVQTSSRLFNENNLPGSDSSVYSNSGAILSRPTSSSNGNCCSSLALANGYATPAAEFTSITPRDGASNKNIGIFAHVGAAKNSYPHLPLPVSHNENVASELPEAFVEQQARQVATDFAKSNNILGAENYYDTLFNDEQTRQPPFAQRNFSSNQTLLFDSLAVDPGNRRVPSSTVSSELPEYLREGTTLIPAAQPAAKSIASARKNLIADNENGLNENHVSNIYNEPTSRLTTFHLKRRFGKNKALSTEARVT